MSDLVACQKGLALQDDPAAAILLQLIDTCPHGAALANPDGGAILCANSFFTDQCLGLTGDEKQSIKHLICRGLPARTVQGRTVFTIEPVSCLAQALVLVWSSDLPIAQSEAERRLRESERRLTAILDTAPVPLVVTSIESGLVLFVNERAARMVGYEKQAMLDRPASLFFVDDDDRARMHMMIQAQDEVQDFETVFRHADGRDVSVVFSATPFYMINELGLLSAITDISKRKEMEEIVRASEERYRTIIDSTSEGFWMIDGGTRVTLDVNQSLCDMLGYPREDLLGSSPIDFVDEDNKAFMQEQAERILSTEQCDFDIELRTRSGRNMPCHFKAARFTDPLFHSVQAFAFITDITPRKEAERALKEAKDEAVTAAKARAEFLAVMSHEIRTPMNGVLGMTKLLLDQPLGERQRRCAETIQHSGESLMVLLNDILDLSKVEAGKLVLESIAFDPRRLFDELHQLMAPRSLEKKLQLLKRVDSGLPDYLVGDPSRLRQILLNLVSNALKFTERGGITLAADFLGQMSPRMARIRFSVADTGIGIDADVQKLLFQEFAQADASIARRFGGTGLGLAISARLAEAMGGKIEISSQSGQGSLFWIDLDMPIAQGVEAKEESQVQVPSLTLLVAEDNAINRQVISGILEARGHVVLLVEDGAQAVSAVEMGHFDAVLMDGWMPVLDGIDATRKIRTLSDPAKASVPIIAMTANVTEADVQSYLAAGMNDALGKPIDLDRLDHVLLKVAKQSGKTGHHAPEAKTSGDCSPSVFPPSEAHGERLDTDILGQLRDTLGLERLDEGFAALPQHWRERSLAIHEAGNKCDWPSLLRLAHDLKGTSGSFGLAGLSAFAANLEAAAKSGDEGASDIEPLMTALPGIVEQAIAALDTWRKNQN